MKMSVRFCLELPWKHEAYDPCEWPTFLTMRMWLARPRVAVRCSDLPKGCRIGRELQAGEDELPYAPKVVGRSAGSRLWGP